LLSNSFVLKATKYGWCFC